MTYISFVIFLSIYLRKIMIYKKIREWFALYRPYILEHSFISCKVSLRNFRKEFHSLQCLIILNKQCFKNIEVFKSWTIFDGIFKVKNFKGSLNFYLNIYISGNILTKWIRIINTYNKNEYFYILLLCIFSLIISNKPKFYCR